MKRIIAVILTVSLAITWLIGCGEKKINIQEEYPDAQVIHLDTDKATMNGTNIEEFDYTWHCDPSVSHDEMEDAPAEYYTGTKPETDAAVYIDHELYYYPMLDANNFKLQNYDGEREWTYYYNDGVHDDYIFATLPSLGNELPTQMMHTEEEASANKVLHITKAGTYALSGEWDGQILIDLGDEDDTFDNPEAKVTILLNGVDITCTVAPAFVYKSAYECDNAWEDREKYSSDVDTSDAGANVVLVEDTVNNVSGTNVFRMLKTVYKDETATDEVKVQKKMRKIDAAFYSYVSMNISGEGTLNVTSGFEGLDSELHLSVNGGNININSQDDGINVNEDNVSVVAINGGKITINAAQGAEGDGIDSNGFIAINGGTLYVNGVTRPDSAMDSEDGVYYEAGNIFIDGEEQSYTKGSVFRETGMTGGMGEKPEGQGFRDKPGMPNDTDFDLKKFKEEVAELDEDATLGDVLELLGIDMSRGQQPNDMNRPQEEMPGQ